MPDIIVATPLYRAEPDGRSERLIRVTIASHRRSSFFG
jgi:hypothetical protein